MMYSFFASFKEADVNPSGWMTDTINRIGNHPINKLSDLLCNPVKLKNMHLDRRIRLFQWNKSYSQKLFLFVCKIFSDYYNRFQEGFYYRFYLVDLYRKVRIGEYIFLRGFSMVNAIYSDVFIIFITMKR